MIDKFLEFFRSNDREISQDRVLQIYGVLLAAVHVLSWIYWNFQSDIVSTLTDPSIYPVCWGFLEGCGSIRPFPIWLAEFLNYGYLAFSLLVVTSFVFFRKNFSYWLLIFLNLVKIFLYLQDYRSMGNYHYMPFIVTFLFLFLPRKREVLQVLIVAFYVGAGILKLNYEWISGAAMIRTPMIEGKLLEFACAYVIVLELAFVWLLLRKEEFLFYFSFIQLCFFHAFSWTIVGFFYPLIMTCILSIFLLNRIWPDPSLELDWKAIRKKSATNLRCLYSELLAGKLGRYTYGALAAFCLMQAIPWAIGSYPSVTTEGRIYSLNMFDSRTRCDTMMIAKFKDRTVETWIPHDKMGYGTRIWCDPLVHYSKAKWICEKSKVFDDFVDIDIYMNSRRSTDSEYLRVFALENICNEDPGFNVFLPNAWIGEWQ